MLFNKKKSKLEISAPTNFQHRVHTGYDNKTQKFIGLPKQWTSLLSDQPSSISRSITQPNIVFSTVKFLKFNIYSYLSNTYVMFFGENLINRTASKMEIPITRKAVTLIRMVRVCHILSLNAQS